MGVFSTSAFAVKATEIFPSGINVNIDLSVDNILDSANCIEDGVATPCSTITALTSRVLAPYAMIDADFLATDFKRAPNIRVQKDNVQTIDPGVYKRIVVDGAGNASGSKPGKLIMNPGLYKIDTYIVNGQVVPADTNGSVTLMVKSEVDLTNGENNCEAGIPYLNPDKFAMYIEDIDPFINGACMSGYLYSKYAVNNLKIDLWGAISAESLVLDMSTNINVDLEYLIFTDFSGFLEVGPNMTAGPNMTVGWHMVKAPAEISATNPVTVADFFGDDLNTSTYGREWIVYQRDYNASTHERYYTKLNPGVKLEKNRGYLLGTIKDTELKVLGLNPVVWDHKMKTKDGCTTTKKGCYRYALQSCTEGDTNAYLYNLVGSVSSTKTYWGDYRVEVKDLDTGVITVMHPDDAFKNNIMSNQIWIYNVGNNGYDIIGTDTSLLPHSIDYFDGFWVEMNCTNSIGKEINLIVPNGKAN
ncbi:hypothetical protein [Sulfurovum sp. TSL1]|uniref:hypothetical protein n=1 Tax=Sulfurovum sp. TSL1 TaxID=2826994 RepID=UPI001CC5C01E|nr:hypothetical protein [Sulfurovum sp. TSL1]GIT98596.1 hypothetical protein TSL1_14170 [Sulfurovum sp. TSL1]